MIILSFFYPFQSFYPESQKKSSVPDRALPFMFLCNSYCALNSFSATFEQIAASFDEAVGGAAGTCTFAVRYTDPDDKVLAEKEFKAQ